MASTDSKLSKLTFLPGFHRESTQYAEEGKWYDGNRVRFREGRPENIRGYQKHNDTAFRGIARDVVTWTDNDNRKHIILGTNKEVKVEKDQVLYDVTPIVTVVSAQNIFSTNSGSKEVGVNIANHGIEVDDRIIVEGAASVGGNINLTIATSLGTGIYAVQSVTDINNFKINAVTVAGATSANAGGTAVSVALLLPMEESNNIQGLGYGAGTFMAGTSTTNYRAWNEAASASNITFKANQWSFDNFEEYVLGVRRGGGIYVFHQDASITPERMKPLTSGTNAPHITATNAPVKSNFLLVGPSGHVITFGTNSFDGTYDPLLVRWSNFEQFNNWAVSAASTSKENPLTDGTEIIGAVRSKNQVLVWTDNSLWGMTPTGDRETVFNFSHLGTKCGLIAPHAAVDYDGIAFWMGENNFYAYDGNVNNLPCTIRRHLFDNFNNTNKDKVYAGINSEFKEIIWLYPKGDSTEPNGYVIYNVEEKTWVYGETFYTTFKDRNIFDNTITTGNTYVWDNEPEDVYTGDGSSLASYIKSASFDLEQGDDIMYLNRIIPDYTLGENQSIKMYVHVKEYPKGEEKIKGPFTINNATQKIDFRARGRQAVIKVSGTNDGSWKWGAVRMALQGDCRR